MTKCRIHTCPDERDKGDPETILCKNHGREAQSDIETHQYINDKQQGDNMPTAITDESTLSEFRSRPGRGEGTSAWQGVADFLLTNEREQWYQFVKGDPEQGGDFQWEPREGKDTKPGSSARNYLSRVVSEKLDDNHRVEVENHPDRDDTFAARIHKLTKEERKTRDEAVQKRLATMQERGTAPGRPKGEGNGQAE